MIVVMKAACSQEAIERVVDRLISLGYLINPIEPREQIVISAVGDLEHEKFEAAGQIRAFEGVDDVVFLKKPYRLVSSDARSKSVVDVDGVKVGETFTVMAGPCTVESEDQLMKTAEAVSAAGAKVLRGGAYKPSTSPYGYQGMGVPGLELLREASIRFGLKVVTEVMDVRKVELVSDYADILQVGTRNMQNYDLLKEVGLGSKPVLLKRGMNSTLEEWLLAAEYVANSGNEQIILCERGIRTFETYTRNTLDLSAVPALQELTHLPVIIDPSQGTGRRSLVPAMCKAAVAVGSDGLLVEVHPNPDQAIKDGPQSITIDTFRELMPQLNDLVRAVKGEVALSGVS